MSCEPTCINNLFRIVKIFTIDIHVLTFLEQMIVLPILLYMIYSIYRFSFFNRFDTLYFQTTPNPDLFFIL